VEPTIYVIAGCNGAGKTTFAMEFLPKEVKCLRFLNADEIARGLSPFQPASAAIKAGRILLEEFHESVSNRESFGLESTLSGRSYVHLFANAKQNGYRIELHYLTLRSVDQAVSRVKTRVSMGGHNIPEADIRRRFAKSRQNLAELYLPLADAWMVWDSSKFVPTVLAESPRHDIDFVREMLK
jgi:predicted ABC-type ATPase